MEGNKKKAKNLMNQRGFVFKDRHVRWNWEKSPSDKNYEDKILVRYHFVITGDRFLEEKLERLQLNFQDKSIISHSFEEIRRLKGKFLDTGLDYLFVSFDTEYPYSFISFEGISKNIKRDSDLRERKVLKIEDYVERLYKAS